MWEKVELCFRKICAFFFLASFNAEQNFTLEFNVRFSDDFLGETFCLHCYFYFFKNFFLKKDFLDFIYKLA